MKQVKYSLLVTALLMAGQSHALGLGKPSVDSYIGEPLRVSAPLILSDAERAELDEGRAAIGGAELFQRFNLPYLKMHTMLRVSIDAQRNREAVLLTSTRPFVEPLIDIPLDIRVGGSRLVRVVTLLLDPPPHTTASPPSVIATTTPPQENKPTRKSPGPAAPQRLAPSKREWSAIKGDQYGPVAPSQTLSDIANELQYDGVTFYQKLVALWRANPQAFRSDNMNSLMAGSTLRLPERSEVIAIAAAAAKREVLAQYQGRASTLVASSGAASQPPSDTAVTSRPVEPAQSDAGMQPQEEKQQLKIAAPLNGEDVPIEYRDTFNSLSVELDALEKENAQLRKRIDSLEQQIAVISELLLARTAGDLQGASPASEGNQSGAKADAKPRGSDNADAALPAPESGKRVVLTGAVGEPVADGPEREKALQYGVYLALFLGGAAAVGIWLLYRRRRQWQRMEQLFR